MILKLFMIYRARCISLQHSFVKKGGDENKEHHHIENSIDVHKCSQD